MFWHAATRHLPTFGASRLCALHVACAGLAVVTAVWLRALHTHWWVLGVGMVLVAVAGHHSCNTSSKMATHGCQRMAWCQRMTRPSSSRMLAWSSSKM